MNAPKIYKTVNLPVEIRGKLAVLAKANTRTLLGELTVLIDAAYEKHLQKAGQASSEGDQS